MNKVDVKWMCAYARANLFVTTPTFSGDTAQRKRGNLRSSSKFAIAIVLTKQTMGVTVIIIPGSKVTIQESRPASDGLAGYECSHSKIISCTWCIEALSRRGLEHLHEQQCQLHKRIPFAFHPKLSSNS